MHRADMHVCAKTAFVVNFNEAAGMHVGYTCKINNACVLPGQAEAAAGDGAGGRGGEDALAGRSRGEIAQGGAAGGGSCASSQQQQRHHLSAGGTAHKPNAMATPAFSICLHAYDARKMR